MTFPTITYKHTNVEPDERLQQLIEQKFSALDKYIGNETDVRCAVEIEKTNGKEANKSHRVEVNFWLTGTLYRAEATDESFEKAVDEVREELDKEVRRAHKKHNSLLKKGGRKIKEMMRRGQ